MNTQDTRNRPDQGAAQSPRPQNRPGGSRIGIILLIVTIVIAVALYFYYFMFSSSLGLGGR